MWDYSLMGFPNRLAVGVRATGSARVPNGFKAPRTALGLGVG
jgi:hypothetical protein